MKMKLLNISITVIVTLSFSCSNSTTPEDPPPLGDFLYGTYVDVHALWSEYSEPGNPSHNAQSTASTYLILNSKGEYTMQLKLNVEFLDTVLNLFEKGTYFTEGTQYVDNSDKFLTFSTWKGTIVFTPEGSTLWEADFSIPESTFDLFFDQWPRLELPDSTGWFIVRNWYRNKK